MEVLSPISPSVVRSPLSPCSPVSGDLNFSLVGDLPVSGDFPRRLFSPSHARKIRQSFHEITRNEEEVENQEPRNEAFVTQRRKIRQSMPACGASPSSGFPMAVQQEIIQISASPEIKENSAEERKSRRKTFAPQVSATRDVSGPGVSKAVYSHVCRMLAESHCRIGELEENLKLAASLGETLVNENVRLESFVQAAENVASERLEGLRKSEEAKEFLHQALQAIKRENLQLMEEQIKQENNEQSDDSLQETRRLAQERRHWELQVRSAEAKNQQAQQEILEARDRIQALQKENAGLQTLKARVSQLESENCRLADERAEREFQSAGDLKARIFQARRAAELVADQLRQEIRQEKEENYRQAELIKQLNEQIRRMEMREDAEESSSSSESSEFSCPPVFSPPAVEFFPPSFSSAAAPGDENFSFDEPTAMVKRETQEERETSQSSSSSGLAISLAWSVVDPNFQLAPSDEARLREVFELLSHQWRIAMLLIESNSAARENAWLPDNALTGCMSCHKTFSTIRRKHHCRLCGGLVCGDCSSHEADLVKFGLKAVRVCNLCWTVVKTMEVSVSVEDEQIVVDNSAAPKFPILCGPEGQPALYENMGNNKPLRIREENKENTKKNMKLIQ